jgi:hypothetical protein
LNLRNVAIATLSSTLMVCAATTALAGEHGHQHHQPAEIAPSAQWEEAAVQVPDLAVVNQDGEHKRFFSDLVKGRVVASTEAIAGTIVEAAGLVNAGKPSPVPTESHDYASHHEHRSGMHAACPQRQRAGR